MLAQTLQVDQLKVPTALGDQLAVRAVFHDPALVEDVDHVGFLNGRQSVRDGNGGTTAGRSIQGGLNHLLGFGVQGAGGFVQKEDLGVAEQGTGDCQSIEEDVSRRSIYWLCDA